MHRARWTAVVTAFLLIMAVIPFLGRRDKVSAAKDAAPEHDPARAALADAAPAPGAGPDAGNRGPAEKAGTSPVTPDPSSLEAIGTLAAAHYFQTYLNIGFIADSKAKGTYGGEEARKDLRSVLSVVDSVDRQLETLGKRPMEGEDRNSLEQMREISAMLRRQGKDLQTFWDSGRDDDAARYQSQRKKVYAAVSKLMGIGP